MVEMEKREGNTKPRVTPSKRWCFTLNNWTEEELVEMVDVFERYQLKYMIGKEVGAEGTPHLQGYIRSDTVIRPMEKLKLSNRIHWEKCRGTEDQNIEYCSKDCDVITNLKIKKKIKDPLKNRELYDWQRKIIEIIEKEPDDRTIYWFWEPKGNIGKTSMSKHICLNHNGIVLSGKAADIKAGVASHIEKYKELEVAIFHFVRSNEQYVSYDALESIKDGIFYSGKYESSMCIFNSPHVICFANFPPDRGALSIDRWSIHRIDITEGNDLPAMSDTEENICRYAA